MKYRYFGTFVPGAEEVVSAMIKESGAGASILRLMSGAAEFELEAEARLPLPYLNNLFRVLYRAQAKPDKAGLEKFLRALPGREADWPAARSGRGRAKSFRVVTSCQNQLTGVSKAAKEALENRLARETGMGVDRSLPDLEFWVLARREGSAYFLKRLTRHQAYDKLLHPGELHPELAYLLCWLAGPAKTVADPFCGYGAIPAQWRSWFGYERLWGFDLNEEALAYAKEKVRPGPGVVLERRDAFTLGEALGPGSLDAIVTDPPWGLYQGVDMPLEEFYSRMLEQFALALKPGGRAVALTAGKRELEAALAKTPALALEARYDILASGKKAGIFVFVRMAAS